VGYFAVAFYGSKLLNVNLRKKMKENKKRKIIKNTPFVLPSNFEVCWDFVKFPLK